MDRQVMNFLEGLASFGVVFTQLVPGTKHTTHTWDRFEEMHAQHGKSRLDMAHRWLRQGYGVGYLLRNRLAVIDADDFATIQRVLNFESRSSVTFPKVHTPGKGLHALLVHPPEINLRLIKHHVCHPKEDGVVVKWDFKLGERTMLVAPGTVTPKGIYQPDPWKLPPVVDVRSLAHDLNIYRSTKPFLRDTRPLDDRIMGAMTYLRTRAPVSVDGQCGRKTLLKVAAHVVAYYGLDPHLAYHLMTVTKYGKDKQGNLRTYKAWNERCVDQDGNPCPWAHDDLRRALEDAVDAVPAHGVKLYRKWTDKRIAREAAEKFITALEEMPPHPQRLLVPAAVLYQSFLEFSGVSQETYAASELGLAITRAKERGLLRHIEPDRHYVFGRIYRGINEATLGFAIEAYRQRHHPFLMAE